MSPSATVHLNEPEQKARTAALQRQSWAEHRSERREAIALGHVRGYLSEHPERAPEFLATIAEALR